MFKSVNTVGGSTKLLYDRKYTTQSHGQTMSTQLGKNTCTHTHISSENGFQGSNQGFTPQLGAFRWKLHSLFIPLLLVQKCFSLQGLELRPQYRVSCSGLLLLISLYSCLWVTQYFSSLTYIFIPGLFSNSPYTHTILSSLSLSISSHILYSVFTSLYLTRCLFLLALIFILSCSL